MCLTKGKEAGMAAIIFESINEVIQRLTIPWSNCVAFSVDKASANVGRHNSIMTRVHSLNPSVSFVGCPCHIIHNTARAATTAFMEVTGCDLEAMMTDLFFWFRNSQERTSSLQDFCSFCAVEYRKILKCVSTRWLSLEEVVNRVLLEYEGLKSYFLSKNCRDARFQRLQKML